jgi:hypothetical protein
MQGNESRAGPPMMEVSGEELQYRNGNVCPNESQNVSCLYRRRCEANCELYLNGCCELAEYTKFIKGEVAR